jgi:hypothetical protein
MATDKKHIAVYLDKANEEALESFCLEHGLKYSAAVNRVLASFFGIEESNRLSVTGTIPNETDLEERLTAIVESQSVTLNQKLAELEERLGKLKA